MKKGLAILLGAIIFGNLSAIAMDKGRTTFGIGLSPSLENFNHKIQASVWDGHDELVKCDGSIYTLSRNNDIAEINCLWGMPNIPKMLITDKMDTYFADLNTNPPRISKCQNIIYSIDPSTAYIQTNHFYLLSENANGDIICTQTH